VTPEVRTTDPEGVDYGWVMQVTFIATIVAGTPVVTALSVFADLATWPERALFAVRVGAAIWLVTLIIVYLYARRYRPDETEQTEDAETATTEDPDPTD
jgi:hypothetical protein